jgi:hypothetical protein
LCTDGVPSPKVRSTQFRSWSGSTADLANPDGPESVANTRLQNGQPRPPWPDYTSGHAVRLHGSSGGLALPPEGLSSIKTDGQI